MGSLRKPFTMVLFVFLLSGCAATATEDRTTLSRKATGIGQVSWIYARSVYENPVNRPVSHFTSLGSVALKSTGGFLRRVSLNSFEMPALSSPVPAVGQAAPMDLQAFERLLDRTTGTRQDKGRIRFLVDGDEYFGRMLASIENARESVDIRTYIFDNDDFAVAMADELRRRANEIRVRVMVDSIGNMLAQQADPESLPDEHQHPSSMSR